MNRTFFAAAGAVITWFAVVIQFYLMMENRQIPVTEIMVRFFSYFTILTNILVAVFFTSHLLWSNSKLKNFFQQPGTVTAVTLYITVVGLVYQVMLRHIWHPQGLQKLVDELLHSVVPVIVILYWSLFVDKTKVHWKQIPSWLVYPSLYLMWILIRGALSKFYPYYFIDVASIGYAKAIPNIILLILLFIFFSCLFVLLAKWTRRISD